MGGAVPQGRGRGLIVLLEKGREGTAGQTIDWLYSIVRSSSYLRLCPFDGGYNHTLLCNVKCVAITSLPSGSPRGAERPECIDREGITGGHSTALLPRCGGDQRIAWKVQGSAVCRETEASKTSQR